MMAGYRHAFIAAAVIGFAAHGQDHQAEAADRISLGTGVCTYDRDKMLSLDEQAFDQDTSNGGSGWRAVAAVPGCALVAADLVRDYRDKHQTTSTTLPWHEGQLRAGAGEVDEAIALMEASRKPREEDLAGWNPYVDATIAFLRKDRDALMSAREQLASVSPTPDLPPVQDGYIELPVNDSQVMKIRWPPNIDVVDGLVRCFGKDYEIAYSNACRDDSP